MSAIAPSEVGVLAYRELRSKTELTRPYVLLLILLCHRNGVTIR